MQQVSDPYRALGVARGATEAEIKAAHRKLVKRYHPDTGKKAETERFLRVQEAYRVLSDPLLRKEWDQKHAPGPVRATPAPPTRPTRRSPTAEPKPSAQSTGAVPPRREASQNQDPRRRPRSARAYTWSASEVPWWEEGINRTEKKPPGRRKPKEAERADNAQDSPPPPEQPLSAQQDFEVYNRSSGAAWSMAARAYFRKGDVDLPRRGVFHHQGTQVVTAGRARSVAQAEARRRAAAAAAAASAAAEAPAAAPASPDKRSPKAEPAPPREPAARPAATASSAASPAAEQPVQPAPPRTAPRPQTGRDANIHFVPSRVAPWPTIGQRLLYSLLGWIPLVILIALATSDRLGDTVASALAGAVLVLLVAIPRVAYVAAIAGVCVLLIGGLFVGALALTGGGLATAAAGLATALVGFVIVGYVATAAILLLGPASLRPWSPR